MCVICEEKYYYKNVIIVNCKKIRYIPSIPFLSCLTIVNSSIRRIDDQPNLVNLTIINSHVSLICDTPKLLQLTIDKSTGVLPKKLPSYIRSKCAGCNMPTPEEHKIFREVEYFGKKLDSLSNIPKLQKLKKLRIENINIIELPNMLELSWLYLCNVQIKRIPILPKLNTLILELLPIKKLPNIPTLETLLISFTKINYIPTYPRLCNLDCSHSPIVKIEYQPNLQKGEYSDLLIPNLPNTLTLQYWLSIWLKPYNQQLIKNIYHRKYKIDLPKELINFIKI